MWYSLINHRILMGVLVLPIFILMEKQRIRTDEFGRQWLRIRTEEELEAEESTLFGRQKTAQEEAIEALVWAGRREECN